MDLLFAAKSPWNWAAEKNFAILKEQNPGLVAAASRGNSVVDPESGAAMRRQSLTSFTSKKDAEKQVGEK